MRVSNKKKGSPEMKLHSRRVKTTGKGKYQTIGVQCRLDMAFNKETRCKALARQFHLGSKAVSLNRMVVADCVVDRLSSAFLEHSAQRLYWQHRMTSDIISTIVTQTYPKLILFTGLTRLLMKSSS